MKLDLRYILLTVILACFSSHGLSNNLPTEPSQPGSADQIEKSNNLPADELLNDEGGFNFLPYLVSGGILTLILSSHYIWWDEEPESFHFKEFHPMLSRSSDSGGTDKFGHMWMNYVLTRLGSRLMYLLGADRKEAIIFSGLTVFVGYTLLEIQDGYTAHGFDPGDFLFNNFGMLLGVMKEIFPELDNYFRFRMGYFPSRHFIRALHANAKSWSDFPEDYAGLTYYFDFILPFVPFLTVGLHWVTKGYQWPDEDPPVPFSRKKERFLGVHVGINGSYLIRTFMNPRFISTKIFYFLDQLIAVPFSMIEFKFSLDESSNRLTFGINSHIVIKI